MIRPLPNGIQVNPLNRLWSKNDLGEYIAPHIAQNMHNIWITVSTFVQEYALLFLVLVIVIGSFLIFLSRLKRKQNNIDKLWNFILFFLSKRVMMIPLLYTLGKREKILSGPKGKRLLDLRDKCREHSLQKAPAKRIEIEEEISELLFGYFNSLEENGKLKKDSEFTHLVQDLEYIDKKLVELQTIYNQESRKWNKFWGRGTFQVFGIKQFQSFE